MTQPLCIVIGTGRSERARTRKVAVDALVTETREDAAAAGKPAISVQHGGGVANKYGYAAETEACVVVAFPCGYAVAYLGTLPANKVTLGGACVAAAGLGRALFDNRYGKAAEAAAREALIAQALQDLLSARGEVRA